MEVHGRVVKVLQNLMYRRRLGFFKDSGPVQHNTHGTVQSLGVKKKLPSEAEWTWGQKPDRLSLAPVFEGTKWPHHRASGSC